MSINKHKNKGFTIVELVIVIAVIGILAAVLIPTFSGVIQKANLSNDIQVCKNMNTALATAFPYGVSYPANVTVAIQSLESYEKNFTPKTNGYHFYWNEKDNTIYLVNDDNNNFDIYCTNSGTTEDSQEILNNGKFYLLTKDGEDLATSLYDNSNLKGNPDMSHASWCYLNLDMFSNTIITSISIPVSWATVEQATITLYVSKKTDIISKKNINDITDIDKYELTFNSSSYTYPSYVTFDNLSIEVDDDETLVFGETTDTAGIGHIRPEDSLEETNSPNVGFYNLVLHGNLGTVENLILCMKIKGYKCKTSANN